MKRFFYIGVLLLSFIFFYSCSSDEQIRGNVDTALQSTAPDVTATVNNRVVTLTGTVTSEQVKTSVGNTIQNIKDVRRVENHLIVESPVLSSPDDAMKLAIETSLKLNQFNYIDVNVVDGVATLTGDIERMHVDSLMNVVNRVNPVKVNNELNMK